MKLFFILMFLGYFLSWVCVHLLCEYKYFFCKGNCDKCHNWRCKFFNEKRKDNI